MRVRVCLTRAHGSCQVKWVAFASVRANCANCPVLPASGNADKLARTWSKSDKELWNVGREEMWVIDLPATTSAVLDMDPVEAEIDALFGKDCASF